VIIVASAFAVGTDQEVLQGKEMASNREGFQYGTQMYLGKNKKWGGGGGAGCKRNHLKANDKEMKHMLQIRKNSRTTTL
jgi:hypothetical protein